MTKAKGIPRETVVNERDIRESQYLNLHGPLGNPTLTALLQDEFPHTTAERLKTRHHNRIYYGSHRLKRPAKDVFNVGAGKWDIVTNDETMDDYLLSRGLIPHPTTKLGRNNIKHEVFLAHVTANLELGARKHGMKLVHEHEVLQGKKREMPVTIHFPVKFWSKDHGCFIEETRKSSVALDPDRYLQLQGKGWLTLFVEVDRGTETLVSANDDVKSWNKTLRKYITVIENDEFNYRKYLGIKSNARVLLVFNSLSKMQAVQKLLDDATRGKGKDYFLFKVWPDFSFPFFVPGEPNWTLFEGPWDRVGHPPFTFI